MSHYTTWFESKFDI